MVALERVERLGERAGHLGDIGAVLLEEVEVGRLAGVEIVLTPSIPAISIAAKARYGFAVASGQRNSMRLAFGGVGVHGNADRGRAVPLASRRG